MLSFELENNSVEVEQRPDFLMARELFTPSGPLTKIFGAIGATAFIAGGVFFGVMETEAPLEEDWWLRLFLGGGLIAIGLAIAWSNFWPTTHVSQFTIDMPKHLVTYGRYSEDSGFEPKGTLAFAAIVRFYAGSETDHEQRKTGSTALYVEADGGPSNGAMMVGSIVEMELLARVVNSMLANAPARDTAPDSGPDIESGPPRRGFGRRGL